ncbi:MAG: hypothetical protein LW717_14525 [Chloroflexaceae bacterium]|nr:hypothetical protein [Chloroflexaceae bacterium]
MIAILQRRWLWLSLGIAIAFRVFVWVVLPRTTWISDEGEYFAAATWLSYGRGFAWYLDYEWTRVPLYPLFVAAHLRIGGTPYWVFVSQIILSLTHILLVRAIAMRLWPLQPLVADIACVLTALCLPLATMTITLLSETLFLTLFLAILWVALGFQIAIPSLWRASMLGVLLAVATLTRSMMLAFVPLLVLWMCVGGSWLPASYMWKRMQAAVVMVLFFVVTIMPWSWYASRTFGGPLMLDTTGAYNLLLTANTTVYPESSGTRLEQYTAALLRAQASPPAQSCRPHPGVLPTPVARQNAMLAEAWCIIQGNPSAFVTRIPSEFVDFWQIHYASAERFTKGFTTGSVSANYLTAVFWFDDVWYILVLFPALIGLWVLRRDGATRSQHELFLLWFVVPILLGMLLFSITRFRNILLPLMSITAAATWVFCIAGRWRELLHPVPGLVMAAAAVVWSLAATPVPSLAPRISPSFFGGSPSVVFCIDLAQQGMVMRQHSNAFWHMLHIDPWLMPIPRPLPPREDAVAAALQWYWRGDMTQATALLPPTTDSEPQLIRADIARHRGDISAAKTLFGQFEIDQLNPLEWAWLWLNPPPTSHIDVGGDSDMGYIRGCYLGEGDATLDATFRWCRTDMQLRFPQAASGFVQRLVFRVDGRAWPADVPPAHHIEVWLGNQRIGTMPANDLRVRDEVFDLPILPVGSDIVITLRGPEFVPDAHDFRMQQGVLAGQVRRLMVRLDDARIVAATAP